MADLVGRAGGGEVALVEQELGRDEAGEGGLAVDFLLQGLERVRAGPALTLAFDAGEGDVGMEGTGLGDEAAKGRGRDDALSEGDEFRGDGDTGKEDAGAVEEAKLLKTDGDGQGMHFGEARDKAAVLLRGGVAEELEGDVPGLGGRPAQAIVARPEPGNDGREFGEDGGRERNADEEAHMGIV